MMRVGACRFAVLSTMIGALSGVGCKTSTCDRDEETVEIKNGHVNEDRTIYVSTLDGEDLVYFPPNRTLVFDTKLAGAPIAHQIDLSFSPDGDSTSPSAGNSSLIKAKSPDQFVIKNDTCSEFYVSLTVIASATPFMPVEGDAGSANAAQSDPGSEAGAAGAAP